MQLGFPAVVKSRALNQRMETMSSGWDIVKESCGLMPMRYVSEGVRAVFLGLSQMCQRVT